MAESLADSTIFMTFEGALEPHRWEQLRDSIIDAAGVGINSVVLDLSRVTFFDSHAIRALLGARKALEPWGVTIHFGPCSHVVQVVVDITGIDQVFPPLLPG